MVTLNQLSKRLKVSTNTISRVLNGQYKENRPSMIAKAKAIREMAASMGYKPNAAARAMRNKQTNQVGIILSGAYTSPYEFPVIIGINDFLRKNGYTLSTISAPELPEDDEAKALILEEKCPDGLFIMDVPIAIRKLAERVVPIHLWVDSKVRKANNCIYRDYYQCSAFVTQKLIDMGYEKLLYVGNREWEECNLGVLEKPKAFKDVVSKNKVDHEIMLLGFAPQEYRTRVPELMELVLQEKTAVIASDQGMAEWCSNATVLEGVCPGRDYGLATCTEKYDCASKWPWLSRLSFDRVDFGKQAAAMMLDLLHGKKRLKSRVVDGEWIIGKTAGF